MVSRNLLGTYTQIHFECYGPSSRVPALIVSPLLDLMPILRAEWSRGGLNKTQK